MTCVKSDCSDLAQGDNILNSVPMPKQGLRVEAGACTVFSQT